jgi:hypothetical protein
MSSMSPRRRWFQFGIGTMLLFITVCAIWLAYELNHIHARQAMIKRIVELGGCPVTAADAGKTSRPLKFQAKVPFWRLWLGDEAVARFRMPDGADAVVGDYRSLFPEADKSHYFTPISGPFAPKVHNGQLIAPSQPSANP